MKKILSALGWTCLLVITDSIRGQVPVSDSELLAFAKRRTEQVRITAYPVWMDYQLALRCVAPTVSESQLKSPHFRNSLVVYTNESGHAAMWDPYATFPEGSIILKEKSAPDSRTLPELFTGMLKREKGFAPEVGDWEFFTIDGAAEQITSRGKLDSCIECHNGFESSDFVTKAYAARRTTAFGSESQEFVGVWKDESWQRLAQVVCLGSSETILLPASAALTHGAERSRFEAEVHWWKQRRLQTERPLEKDERAPEDLTGVGGPTLRYEPASHKNTLGYWTSADDSASWVFQAQTAGPYQLEVLQGCGTGSGGSEVEIEVSNRKLNFVVEETGHFQNFVWRTVGQVELVAQQEIPLTVRVKNKTGPAVMDLRQIRLTRIQPSK